MTELTLLTRPGCHLCDEMKAIVTQVQTRYPLRLREIDISTQAELVRRHGNDIPVLLYGNRVLARHRISVPELSVALSALSEGLTETTKNG